MEQALSQAKKTSTILPLAKPETVSTNVIALSQYCFWTGELAIGSIPGVVKTEAGWLKGREVTLVHFDPAKTNQKTVVSEAKKQSCANQVFSGADLKSYRAASQSDQKRQMQGTRFAKLTNLTAYQRTKINAFARTDLKKAKTFLTASQAKSIGL